MPAKSTVKSEKKTPVKKVVKKLISKGKKNGYLTIDELNSTLPEKMFSNKKLDETPVGRDGCTPTAIGSDLPPLYFPPAADDCPGFTAPDYRSLGTAAVSRRQHQRLSDPMYSRSQGYLYRFRQFTGTIAR